MAGDVRLDSRYNRVSGLTMACWASVPRIELCKELSKGGSMKIMSNGSVWE